MAEAPVLRAVRFAALAIAVVVLVVFLLAQRRAVDVSYGESPSPREPVPEGAAGELAGLTVPSVEEMTALVEAAPVVRLPGATATWDEALVDAAVAGTDGRVLGAPAGLDEDERDRVRDVENATVLVIGTEVTDGVNQAYPDTIPGWRAQFALADVTNEVLDLVALHVGDLAPADVDPFRRREPTPQELEAVAADLRDGLPHVAPGAALDEVPDKPDAFPGDALYAVFPVQERDAPVPDYGSALTAVFPDRPVVVMYGNWVEYHGPHADDFAEVAAASFYGQFSDRIDAYAYPQAVILAAYLDRVTDLRYAGLFDRPLPYRAPDPLDIALPALPWAFTGCVAAFLALSARAARVRPGEPRTSPARLAALSALAVEVSALSRDASLTRGLARLGSAREALETGLPEAHVRRLLDAAEAELDTTARQLGRPDYRPSAYLRGSLA
ncbi:hypothetical protein [Actinosynnema sp.]|uniref:hypothetical protein n=1 Tax=Actinosynnema sp. TaxID=1872144 RepID=UPI003F836619